MSRWEFLAWVIPFFWLIPQVAHWLGFGFFAGTFAGVVFVLPVVWLAKKVVRPEDLK